MAYDLIISERANELIDRLAAYLLNNLKNPGAAARHGSGRDWKRPSLRSGPADEAYACFIDLFPVF